MRYVRHVGAESFDVLAASLRADARDMQTFLEVLAVKLAGAFPDSTEVERKGLLGGGTVRAIRFAVGDHRYRVKARGGRALCSRAQEVRGIVLKTEDLGIDEWLEALSRDLAEAAQKSERERLALDRLLMQ
jgi:hypothetical protein